MLDIPCVILSGGKSSRMGEDKSLLPFKNSTLIEYQYNRLSKIFKKVYISSKTNKFDFDCDIIYDNNSDISSPMVALESILDYIETKVFIIGVDIPFVRDDTILKLVESSKSYNITVAKDEIYIHNLCGVYSKSILPIVKTYINNNIHKINNLLQADTNIVTFTNKEQFLNLNNKEQYKEALKINHKN